MFGDVDEIEFHEKQKMILRTLLQQNYIQKDLAKKLKISGAGLLYHLNYLEKKNLIKKDTLMKVGNASINEISIQPNSIQQVRMILGIKKNKYCLITGFGKDSSLGKSHLIPSQSAGLLKNEGYNIVRKIAFCTPESNIEMAKKIGNVDKFIIHEYEEYRNNDSDLMKSLESIIQVEQENNDLILDLTPLTKLLTIKLLKFSYKYKIPSFYLGRTKNNDDFLLWIFRSI